MFLRIDKVVEEIHIGQVDFGSAFVKALVDPLVKVRAVSEGEQMVKVNFSSHDGRFFRMSDTGEKRRVGERNVMGIYILG